MAERVRIQKAIAHAGLMSRRAAEEAISDGRIQLNGQSVVLGDRVDPDSDVLTLDGVLVPVSEDTETHLLYKPVGVVSTASDPQRRTTVVDLVNSDKRLYPVGRLDVDSEGLILVSNDGELTNRVTHPRYGVTKTYLVEVKGKPSKPALRHLREGVELDDGPATALSARLIQSEGQRALVEVVLGEGRNREVRRMFEAVGHEVTRLVRTAIGRLNAPDLTPGTARRLTPADVQQIFGGG